MHIELKRTDREIKSLVKNMTTRSDLADLLEIPVEILNYHVFVQKPQYSRFLIPKKSGGVREIYKPLSTIQILQSKLSRVFALLHKPHSHSFAFIKNRGIVRNALLHCNRRWVFNVDLEGFFPSITSRRVYGALVKYIRFAPHVAYIVTRICTLDDGKDGFLPQGAPSSPLLSDIIASQLDQEMSKMAFKLRCRYSRYADDITFSTNLAEFPAEIAFRDEFYDTWLSKKFEKKITEAGFFINFRKARLQSHDRRQEVTGLIVNGRRPNVPRKFQRNLRAMLHSWRTKGYAAAQEQSNMDYALSKSFHPFKEPPPLKDRALGKLEFLGMVRGKNDAIYKKYRSKLEELLADL